MLLWFACWSAFAAVACFAAIPNPTGLNLTICQWRTRITDPQRADHEIPLITHYPCGSGTDNNTYPLLVFGHASQSQDTWYDYIWEAIVPQGYIVTLLGSYEYLDDNHLLFASDMAYTQQYFNLNCNRTQSCPLYAAVGDRSMVSGHSMGGASALLVAAENKFDSMLTLSGCGVDSNETNYTAAARTIDMPSLFLTGNRDCMCKPPFNESIVGYYNNEWMGNCKYLGIITGATHCQFSSEWTVENSVCQIVEDTECLFKPPPKIEREQQWRIVNTYFALFMYQTLYADNDAKSIQMVKNQLNNDLESNVMNTIQYQCN